MGGRWGSTALRGATTFQRFTEGVGGGTERQHPPPNNHPYMRGEKRHREARSFPPPPPARGFTPGIPGPSSPSARSTPGAGRRRGGNSPGPPHTHSPSAPHSAACPLPEARGRRKEGGRGGES